MAVLPGRVSRTGSRTLTNLGMFLQSADLPEEVATWSLASLQTRLIKFGARVVRHARSITFQLAAVAVPRQLFQLILASIHGLRPLEAPK